MKTLLGLTFFTLTLGLRAIAAPALVPENSISGAEMKVCRPDGLLCLNVKSDKTIGSQFAQLHRLKNPRILVDDRKTKKVTEIRPLSAYIDLANDQLVWIEERGRGRTFEVSYDLQRLERSEMRQ